VEYLVRAARITDIDRILALGEASWGRQHGPLMAADLFRQLVSLPQASVLVAELQRDVAGSGVLVLRPSVRAGGYVGTIDLLVVGPGHDLERVSGLLVDELIRSATNKGCTMLEIGRPRDPVVQATLERVGFADAAPVVARPVGAVREIVTRSI
jgi:hypothetical protein